MTNTLTHQRSKEMNTGLSGSKAHALCPEPHCIYSNRHLAARKSCFARSLIWDYADQPGSYQGLEERQTNKPYSFENINGKKNTSLLFFLTCVFLSYLVFLSYFFSKLYRNPISELPALRQGVIIMLLWLATFLFPCSTEGTQKPKKVESLLRGPLYLKLWKQETGSSTWSPSLWSRWFIGSGTVEMETSFTKDAFDSPGSTQNRKR